MKLSKRLIACGLLVVGAFALLLVAAAGRGTAAQAHTAQPESSVHKVLAPAGAIVGDVEGMTLWQDYGAYALYRVTDQALAGLSSAERDALRVVDDMDTLLIDAFPFDTQRGSAVGPAHLRAGAVEGASLQLIQFVGPIRDQWLDAVRATGAVPVHYIASNGYLIWADGRARARLDRMAAAGEFLQYSALYEPFFKFGPSLAPRVANPATMNGAAQVKVTIQIYDHPASEATKRLIRERTLEQHVPWSGILNYENSVVTMTLADLLDVAQRTDVYWIGERFERERLDEVQGQIVASNFDGSQSGPSAPGYRAWLDGYGVSTDPADYPIVDVTDDGIGNGTVNSGDPTLHELGLIGNPTRLAFVQSCHSNPSGEGTDGHGHINTSIVGGFDERGGFPFQDLDGYQRGMGINPYGRIAGTRIFAPSFSLAGCGGTDSGLIQASYNAGARISSNSWGCSGCAGSYDDSSQAFDVGTRDADLGTGGNQELLFIFSAGNSGPSGGTIGSPGNGKNMLTVGASENDRPADEDGAWTDGCAVGPTGADDAMDIINFSSRGPSPGNRIKPETIAPGTHVQGTASTNAGYNGSGVCDQYRPSAQTTFASSSGTSHSAPAVAGASSLYYYWLEATHGFPTPSPALVKGYVLAHPTYLTGLSANDTLPSNNQGYGMPDLSAGLDDTPRYIIDQSVLFDGSGETWTFNGAVADPAKPVRIVLNYSDAAGAIGTSPQVNNLDLAATVGGTPYLGNVFSGQWSVTGGAADTANNYEAIFLPAGTTGALDITITAFNIAGDGVPGVGDGTDQDFALVCYNCAEFPDFALSATPPSAEICAPDDAVYTIDVESILGYTDPVTLAAAGNPAGTSAGFSTNPVTPPGSSVLTISGTGGAAAGSYGIDVVGVAPTSTHTITVGLDLFDGVPGGVTLVAPADAATDVDLLPTMEWTAATQGVSYDLEIATDAGFATVVYSATVAGTSHDVISGLDPVTTYYWRVTASNICGDGAASATWSFTTRDIPPILLVDDDDNSPDVRATYTDALDNLGAAYDLWDTANSDNEPDSATLLLYETVIWFTGDEFGGAAGPGGAGETALGAFLDAGHCLAMVSQDYLFDRGLTPFGNTYLGIDSFTSDVSQTTVTGAGTLFTGFGPYTLSYPFSNFSDIVNPTVAAETAFTGNQGNAAVDLDSGVYRTVFFGYPWEAIADSLDREAVMLAILDYCGAGIDTGTLQGTVTDASTTDPIVGAEISADDGGTVRMTTTDGSGNYSLTLPVGSYDVTADAMGYEPQTVSSVAIVTDTTTVQDFALAGSGLVYSPPEIEEFMQFGDVVTNTVTVTNTGPITVNYSVSIGGYSGPNLAPQEPVSIPASDGLFARGEAPASMGRPATGAKALDADDPRAGLTLGGVQAYGVNLLGDTLLGFMTDDATNPTTIGAAAGNHYAGDFSGGDFSTLYSVDDATSQLLGLDTTTGAQTVIGPMVASGGETWTGMAGDPTSGEMYATSSNCTTSTLYTIDLNTGTPTSIGTGSGCLIDIAVNAAGEMYAVDIIGDQLMSVDKTTGATTAIGSLGFDANFAQGMDFDEDADILYLAAYNNATSAGELRVADVTTGATVLISPIGGGSDTELDAFAIATGGSGAGGWAYAVPDSGAVAPFSVDTFDVVFDASSLTQTGDYSAELSFSGDFAGMVPTMPLTMHLSCPSCGFLDGDVYDADTLAPVSADIHVTGPGGFDVMLSGDSYFLSVQPGLYSFDVSAAGYLDQTADVTAVQGVTVTTDFVLVAAVATLEYAPATIEDALLLGDSTVNSLVISNTGTVSFSYEIQDVETGYSPTLFDVGGPDGFGYTYIDSNEADGPAFDWIDISGTGTAVLLGDDAGDGPFPLGFDFDFYGVTQSDYYIGSNGYVSFNNLDIGDFGNNCPIPDPSATDPNDAIYLYWDDLDPGDTGDAVYYESFATCPYAGGSACTVVQYEGFHHFPGGGDIAGTFEAILFDNGNVLLQYLDAGSEEGSGSTSGIENVDGTIGLQYGTCNSAGHIQDNLAVCIAHPDSGDPSCQGLLDAPWAELSVTSGTLDPGEQVTVDVTFDSSVVTQTGTYTGSVLFSGSYDNDVAPAELIMHVTDAMPAIDLAVTVGTDAAICGATDTLTVPEGTAVTYCYTVNNTGTVTLTTHTITDSVMGHITTFNYDLGPGTMESVLHTVTPTMSITSTVTWDATGPIPTGLSRLGLQAIAMDDVYVTVEPAPPTAISLGELDSRPLGLATIELLAALFLSAAAAAYLWHRRRLHAR